MSVRKSGFAALLLGALLLLFSACSPSTASTPTAQTVLQLLQNSSTAMKQLKSAHVELSLNTALQSSSSSSQSQSPMNLSFTVQGSGNIVPPDKSSLNITFAQSTYSEITIGDKLYIKNSKGQWYVLDMTALKQGSGTPTPTTGAPDVNKLLDTAQKAAKFTDHGTETLNGVKLHHVTVTLDKAGIQQILANDSQLSSQLGQANIDKVLNSFSSFNGSIDFWIDDATYYVHRTEVKLDLGVDLSSLLSNQGTPIASGTATPSNITLKLDTTVDLSKFNDPVTITAPAGAIPTTDPISIFE